MYVVRKTLGFPNAESKTRSVFLSSSQNRSCALTLVSTESTRQAARQVSLPRVLRA